MITFQEETYETLMLHPEFKKLTEANWKETGVLNPKHKLCLNLEVYKNLEIQKLLVLFSVKEGSILVGYFMGIIVPHQYYYNTTIAQSDAFFILSEYRRGLIGYKFLKYVVKNLKIKVNIILFNTNVKRNLSKLLIRLGFKLADYQFVLEV